MYYDKLHVCAGQALQVGVTTATGQAPNSVHSSFFLRIIFLLLV